MRKKGLAFFSFATTVSVFVFVFVACEDDKPSTFNNGSDEASFDSGGSFNTDANQTGDVKGPVQCLPSLPATFAPVWKPPVAKAGQCTTAELTEYYDACLPDAVAKKCTDWVAAHGTCAECIEPDDNSGVVQLYNNRSFYTLNLAGCIATVQKANEPDKCGGQFDLAAQCRRQSCDECFQKGGNFDNFTDCQREAAKDPTGCKPYEDRAGAACVGFQSADGGAPDCFRKQGEGERDHFIRVEGVMCGPT